MNKKMIIVPVLSAGLFFGGCAGTNNGTMSNKQKGALIGGISGAAIGLAAGGKHHRGKGALIGGLVGALAGTGIGAYMDKQEQELKSDLEGTGIEVERDGDNINLNMPSSITFDTGKSNIKPDFSYVLSDVANVLAKYNRTTIEIQGHTDSVGTDANNQRLSELRAQSVASALRSKGVSRSRMTTVGFGESMPIASNDTAQGREQNRRVEIVIIPDNSNFNQK